MKSVTNGRRALFRFGGWVTETRGKFGRCRIVLSGDQPTTAVGSDPNGDDSDGIIRAVASRLRTRRRIMFVRRPFCSYLPLAQATAHVAEGTAGR